MPPILKKTQKGLPQFVTSHLPFTFLILEGVSFNVNQGGKTSLGTGDSMPQTGGTRYSASWWNRRLFSFGLTSVLRMEWWLMEPTGSGLLDMTLAPTRNLVISPSSRNQGTKWRWGAQGDDKQFSSSIYNCHRGKYSCPGFF